MYLTAFLFGLLGSAGHCVGMCSGVTLLLRRTGAVGDGGLPLAHLGRLTTYSLLGLLAGSTGLMVGQVAHGVGAPTHLNLLQGVLALLAAGLALYMGLAISGRLPAPERYLGRLTRLWGHGLQRLRAGRFGEATPFLAGMLWGLLPCGLVLAALLTAAATAVPWQGAGVMLAFGAGTGPLLLLVSRLAGQRPAGPDARYRTAAAVLVCLFGLQLALRGFASWGWIAHQHLGPVSLW